MYGPESYIFESNLALLAALPDEELTDAALAAQLAPGVTALGEIGAWLVDAVWGGLAAVGEVIAIATASGDTTRAS